MRAPRWYLGVDGGGTKTAAVLMDAQGRVRARAEGSASLRTVLGWSASARAARDTVAAAERVAGVRPRYTNACFALAGVDAPEDAGVGHRHLRRVLGRRIPRFHVVNDTYAALRAGTAARFGVVVIAGTGSNALARGPRGEFRAGGWGWVMGDDGSGFWIGRAGLRAALRSLDGRGPTTALWPALARALGTRSLRGVHDLLAEDGYPKRTVSHLSRTVDRISRRDPVARVILVEAARRLAVMAEAVARRAGLGRSAFPLVVSGGCFNAPVLLRAFRATVRSRTPRARVLRPRREPAVGAALLAKELE